MVPNTDIQIVSNEAWEPTAVLVPIEIGRQIAAAQETAYLLSSETMKQRIPAVAQRADGLSLDAVVEKLGMRETSNSIPLPSRTWRGGLNHPNSKVLPGVAAIIGLHAPRGNHILSE